MHAAGIAAGGDDAEITARLRERVRIDVGLFSGIFDGGRRLGAMRERVFEEPLRALAAFGGFAGFVSATLDAVAQRSSKMLGADWQRADGGRGRYSTRAG